MTIARSRQPAADASAARKLQIDVWSDLSCPWCYIGKHRLDQAIASSAHSEAISVRLHSFELDPDMSKKARPNLELLAARYRLSLAQARAMEEKAAAIAHRDGLPFKAERVAANSFDVHRVLHLAASVGLANELMEVLQHALFGAQANVFDHATLVEEASRVGVPRGRVEEVLSSDEYADAVLADEEQARALGVTLVPFLVFDERIAMPGTTSVQGFTEAIEQAWSGR